MEPIAAFENLAVALLDPGTPFGKIICNAYSSQPASTLNCVFSTEMITTTVTGKKLA